MVSRFFSRLGLWILDTLERRRRSRAALLRMDHELKEQIAVFGWRAVFVGFIGQLVFPIVKHLLPGLPIWADLIGIVTFLIVVNAYLERRAFQITAAHVRDRTRWVWYRRRNRLGAAAPYERMAPVASASCSHCSAEAGTRHASDCASIPVGWFNRRNRREQR